MTGRSDHEPPGRAKASCSRPRPAYCRSGASRTGLHRRHGRAALRWNEIPLRDPFPDTRAIAARAGARARPSLQRPSAVSMGNPARDLLGRDAAAYDLTRIGPILENDPVFPRARQYLAARRSSRREHILLRVWERGAGLTRACGSAACATVVAASRARADGPQRHRHAAGRRSRHRVARERTTTC